MTLQNKARELTEINNRANAVLDGIRRQPDPDATFMETQLKKYIGLKLMLDENEISDNITLMVQTSVAKSLHITINELPGVDKPGQCGNASAVLGKRIQLFLAIQKGLDVSVPARKTPSIKTVHDLASILMSLM